MCGRKRHTKAYFKVGKQKCRLGVCNEYGIRVFDFKKDQDSVLWGRMGTMLKTTSLGREVSLSVKMRIMSEYVHRLKGMHGNVHVGSLQGEHEEH